MGSKHEVLDFLGTYMTQAGDAHLSEGNNWGLLNEIYV